MLTKKNHRCHCMAGLLLHARPQRLRAQHIWQQTQMDVVIPAGAPVRLKCCKCVLETCPTARKGIMRHTVTATFWIWDQRTSIPCATCDNAHEHLSSKCNTSCALGAAGAFAGSALRGPVWRCYTAMSFCRHHWHHFISEPMRVTQ